MKHVIPAEAMRRCEEVNFANGTADALELMYAAGVGCGRKLLDLVPALGKFTRLVILCGWGNNGGDGVVMASFLAGKISAEVVLAPAVPGKLSDSSRYFFERLDPAVKVIDAAQIEFQAGDVIADALLGSGCHGNMREPLAGLIKRVNSSKLKVFALDMPSGLGSDLTVKADFTAVIGCFKSELFTPEGVENSGILRLVPLNLPIAPESNEFTPEAADMEFFLRTEKAFPRNIHKYQRGSVLIAGGSSEYIQAPFLSGLAALRNGSGMVRLALPFAAAPGCGTLALIASALPEVNGALSKESFSALEKYLNKINVIAAGPGMGRQPHTAEFVEQLVTCNKPLLLDADALFFAGTMVEKIRKRTAPVVLTPHRGEAKMLASALNKTLPEDDLAAAAMLSKAYNAVVLLKGPRTVIADPSGKTFINTSGTPALATAGSGDVLTGLIASEMCHHPALTAAARGAFLHGLSGEYLTQRYSEYGVIADDLPLAAAGVRALLHKNCDIFE